MKSRQSAIEKDRLLHNPKDVENKRSSDFAFIQLLIRFSSVIMSFDLQCVHSYEFKPD
jgi:hypothetical protein